MQDKSDGVPEVHLVQTLKKLFQTRDELSFRNVRFAVLPVLFVFPLSVIMGNLRFYDHSIVLAGFKSSKMTLFLLGLGWLLLALTPKKFIIPVLQIAAGFSVVIMLLLISLPVGFIWFTLYMAFKFFNGLCAACAFYLFCFVLNNIERLFGMVLIQFYYAFYYAAWSMLPAFHEAGETWGGLIISVIFLVIVLLCRADKSANLTLSKLKIEINTGSEGKGSGIFFVIVLDIVYYMIVCMLNYIEWSEYSLSGLAFGAGTLISIGLIIVIQLRNGSSALNIWLAFLVLSLLGIGALLYDRPLTLIFGSFSYGFGDGLGYIIIYYMCAGAIKRSKSLRMFKLYCFVFFIEYFVISGLFNFYFNYFEEPNKFLAFGVVLVLVSSSLLLMPLMQKKFFEADWTDGLYLRDMDEYSKPFAETEKLSKINNLDLTPREQEIFTMLLTGMAPKEIAYTLKVSYYTVDFHRKNLYRKLGIQSRAELFSKYSAKT